MSHFSRASFNMNDAKCLEKALNNFGIYPEKKREDLCFSGDAFGGSQKYEYTFKKNPSGYTLEGYIWELNHASSRLPRNFTFLLQQEYAKVFLQDQAEKLGFAIADIREEGGSLTLTLVGMSGGQVALQVDGGKISVAASGISGNSCVPFTSGLLESLGAAEIQTQFTQEYFDEQTQVMLQQQIG